MSISDHYPELFHYTDFGGAKGIILSNNIRATHYGFLNDKEEALRLSKFFREHLFEENKLISDHLNHAIDNMQNALLGKESTEPYIASFCTPAPGDDYVRRNGLLSQWRGYAEDGYAIVFDTKRIEELIHFEKLAFPGAMAFPQDQILKIVEAVYNEKDFCEKYPSEIKILNEYIYWLAKLPFIKQTELDKLIYSKETIMKMHWEWTPAFMRCVALYKNEGFREEREIRIIAFLVNEKYRNGRKSVKKVIHTSLKGKPYLELFKLPEIKRVKSRYPSNYLGIKRIIVAPGEDSESRVKRIKEFLLANNKNFEVVISEIPYINPVTK